MIMSFVAVGHQYRIGGRELRVLDNVTFEVSVGERIAIVGPSGAGKSTIMKAALGLIQPTSGEVHFGTSAEQIIRRAVVFQDPTLLPWLTAAENVKLPLEIEERTSDPDILVDASLQMVGLTQFRDFRPAQLSGGMQSRVALARALVTQPDVMILDEPFSNLDEATSEAMVIELSRLVDQNRAAVVMITHSLSQAVFMADRILVLSPRPGQIFRQIDISARRPRTGDLFQDSAFHEQVNMVRQVLREAIHADNKLG